MNLFFSSLSNTNNDTIPIGHKVAALVGEDEWILAVVIKHFPVNGKYQVRDADEEEQQLYTLPATSVIPTQIISKKTGGFSVTYDLDKDSSVLAVFPETTVFYRATVVSSVQKVRISSLL